uniref:Uncharacterized protein n=1 Tax=Oryza brachyantha TaxID=4533 RepID=J3NAE5_ORYBR
MKQQWIEYDRLNKGLDRLAVVPIVGAVSASVPEHGAAVVARRLRPRHHAVEERLGVYPAVRRLRRRQPHVHLARREPRRPGVPGLPEVGRLAVVHVVAARRVVVEPRVDALYQPRPQRRLGVRVRVPAPRRRRQHHRLAAAAVSGEAFDQHVVVRRPTVVDVEVDAVEHRVAEGAEDAPAAAAEVGVPEMVSDVLGRPGGGQRVLVRVLVTVAAGGEEDEDVLGLAVLDVGADPGDVMAGEVGPVAAVAEDAEEGDDDGGVDA